MKNPRYMFLLGLRKLTIN